MKNRSYKQITAILLAMILLLSSFSGCQPAATMEQPTTEPLQTQTLSADEAEAQQAEFGLSYVDEYGFNPYTCTCITNRPVISLVFESLFVVNEKFQPEPLLCDKFSVSEDSTSYLIKLREEARFSDGSPVTANDVVTSLRAASNSAYYGSRFHFVRSFTAYNETTVKIDLYTPYETLPLLLDVPICKEGTEKDKRPVGSGPYRLLSSKQYLYRVEDWWQDGSTAVNDKYIRLQAAQTPIAVRDSFEFGTTNLVLADPNSAASVGYRCDYELWNCNTTAMQYLGFNTARGIFSNASLRSRVTWLIDRETICAQIYHGFAYPASLPCSPQSMLYDKEIAERYAYDPNSFAQWRRETTLDVNAKAEILVWSADYSRVELANFIAGTLTTYGIQTEVTAVDYTAYKRRLKNGEFDLFLGEVRLSNDFDLTEFFSADGDLNFGSLTNNTAYDKAVQMLANSGNAYALYEQVMENGLLCPILFKSYAVMVTRGELAVLKPAIDNVFHLPGGRTLADADSSYEELAGQN